MASYFRPVVDEDEEEFWDDDGGEERSYSDGEYIDRYDDSSIFDTDDEGDGEHDEDDEDIGDGEHDEDDDDDVDANNTIFDFDVDEEDDEENDEEEGEGEEEEAADNEMPIDGGEQQPVEEIGREPGKGDPAEPDRSSSSDCPICYRPWTADGPHRAFCFPCGHVNGRSCLETWLHRCGETKGKCPQCVRKFTRYEIINLNAPSIVIPNLYKNQ